jgi:magnesium chelatase family protein
LPDAAVREAYHRVRTAFRSLHLSFPRGQVVVNLAPARLRKAGSGFDLGIALALAALAGYLPRSSLCGAVFVGEVGLDGKLRGVPGILSVVELMKSLGLQRLVCAEECAPLAALAGAGLVILPATSLGEAMGLCREGPTARRPVAPLRPSPPDVASAPPDLSRVRGQESARRALVLAAVGGHNLLLSGPPGCGKTLLARCLPGLLPPLAEAERIEVLRVRSAFQAGEPADTWAILAAGLPPWRAPHHTVSYAGLVGGGKPIRPGEITLAHHGVLFLDELPEFARDALEALRQPLESGHVELRRAQESIAFPARFQLVAAMNPCPCGNRGHPRLPCRDTPLMIQRYQARISGPLLDRIDLHLDLRPVTPEVLLDPGASEPLQSPALRERVARLRQQQMARNGGLLNRDLDEASLRTSEHLARAARSLLLAHCRRGSLSARGIVRVLRVARSAADLAAHDRIEEEDLAEALCLRGETVGPA